MRTTPTLPRVPSREAHPCRVRQPGDIEGVLGRVIRDRPDALFVVPPGPLATQLPRILDFAAQQRLPAIYTGWGARAVVEAGRLMSYGPSLDELYRRSVVFIDKVLKGTPPADFLSSNPPSSTSSSTATRRFALRPRRRRDGSGYAFDLRSGSLLVMGGTCQRHFVHGVPRQADAPDERISLTFRWLLRPPDLVTADRDTPKETS